MKKLFNDLLVGVEAKVPTGIKIKNKQIFVRALTHMEEAICRSQGVSLANSLQKGDDGYTEDEGAKEILQRIFIDHETLYKACVDQEGEPIFESKKELKETAANVLDPVLAFYLEERNGMPIDKPLTDEIIEQLKDEVKKNPIFTTELSRIQLIVLINSLVEEGLKLQEDSTSSGGSSRKQTKK